jgi:hypothetical protein
MVLELRFSDESIHSFIMRQSRNLDRYPRQEITVRRDRLRCLDLAWKIPACDDRIEGLAVGNNSAPEVMNGI